MSIVLLESEADPASRGIAAALKRREEWSEAEATFQDRPVWNWGRDPNVLLASTPTLHIQAEGLDAQLRSAGIQPELIIFLSKHKSESGRPTLTVHPVGNYAQAAFGGTPGRLTPTPGPWLSQALRCLKAAQEAADYAAEVSFEATHHGPLLDAPAFFLELGSAETQWADPAGHRVLADAVVRLVEHAPPDYPVTVGLGGGHYAPRFTEAALTKQIHFAHMLPTYHAKGVQDVDRIAAELARASPGATTVYYHDGTLPKSVRDRWLEALARHGLQRVESRTWPALEEETFRRADH